MKTFAENLRRYRKVCGLTQAQVARRIQVDRTTYTKYESGAVEPSIATLRTLCDVLQVTPNDLFGWESE